MNQTQLFDDEQDGGACDLTGMAVSVLVPYPVDKAYDYLIPDGEYIGVGD